MLRALDLPGRGETRIATKLFGQRAGVYRQSERLIIRTGRHRSVGIGRRGRRRQPNLTAGAVTGDSIAPSDSYLSSTDCPSAEFDMGDRQQLALRTAAIRLKGEFADTTDAETIEQILHSSYGRLAWRAKVLAFLPLLTERLTRQHLLALASVEETTTDAEPSVLFASYTDVGISPVTLAPSTTSSRSRTWSAWGARSAASTSSPAAVETESVGQVPFPVAVSRRGRKLSQQLMKITTSVGVNSSGEEAWSGADHTTHHLVWCARNSVHNCNEGGAAMFCAESRWRVG